MSNVILKDDENYPELLKKIGKDAPKQIYYKVSEGLGKRSSHSDFFERFTLKGSDARQNLRIFVYFLNE